MAHTTSQLRTKLTTEAQNNEGIEWSTSEAAVELLLNKLGAAAITSALPVGTNAIGNVGAKQYAGVPSSFVILTADGTVFTLAAGEVGFIQNLSADAPLAVKKGASASTTSLNFILAKSTAASDGTGGACKIDDWIGVVSVAKMTGTASYLAWKQAVA